MKKAFLELAIVAVISSSASAANLYWDNNGAVANAGTGDATTIWNTAAVWNTDSAGGNGTTPVPGTWVGGSDAVFTAGTGYSGTITITPNAAVAANSITVNAGTVLTNGQVVTIGAANGAAGITINSGTKLSISSTTQIVPSSTPNLVLNGGTFENRVGANGSTFLNPGFKIVLAGAGGTLSMPGPGVSTSFAFNYLPTVGISGSGGLTLTGNKIQFRPGTATYSYTGPTTITSTGGAAGPMEFKQNTSTNNILPTATDLTVNSNAVFNLGLANAQVASLSGTGIVASAAATRVFTISGSTPGNDSTFSGVIQDSFTTLGSVTGTLGITKSGTSTQTLSGANTYSGPTTISATSVIAAANNTALGTTAGNTTVASTGALQIKGSGLNIAEPLQINGTGVSSDGALRNLLNDNTYSGPITLAGASQIQSDGGTLTIDTAATIKSSSTTARGLTVGGAGNTTILSVIGDSTNAINTLTKSNGGTLTLSGANIYTSSTTISGGTLKLGASGVIPDTSNVTNNATLDMNGFAETIGSLAGTGGVTMSADLTVGATNGSASHSGAISGNGNLTKVGTGNQTLSGTNTYSGITTISAGTLSAASAGALGDTSNNTQVANGAELRFDGAAVNFTISEPIQLAGGAGTLAEGALNIRNSANVNVSGPVTLIADTTIAVSSSATGTYSNAAAFTATDKSLTLQGGSGAGGGGTISGVISLGTGGVTKQQAGTWTLTAANNYSGPTNINAGILKVNNTTGSATGTGAVTIGTGGTLAGTGSVAGPVTVNGTLSPGNSPGMISVGSPLSFSSTATYDYQIDSSVATSVGADLTNVSGAGLLSINSAATLKLTDVATTPAFLPVGTKFTLIGYTADLTPTDAFAGKADGSTFLFSDNEWKILYADPDGAGSNFAAAGAHFVTITVVPEANGALLGGLVCLVVGIAIGGKKLLRRRATA